MFYIKLIIIAGIGGLLSGLLGIGGAIIIIPALVFFGCFSQKIAQGTTLFMMLPPIGLLAALIYWKQGQVNIKAALIMGISFILLAGLGAYLATVIPNQILKKCFAFFMFLASIYYFFV